MELKIDLLGKGRRIVFLVAGTYFFLVFTRFVFLWDGAIDWTLACGYAIIGAGFVYMGFTKTYVLINSELIFIKKEFFVKNLHVKWSEIKRVNYKSDRIELIKTDNTNSTIFLDLLSYSSVKQIKKIIFGIAKEKEIAVGPGFLERRV